MHDVTLNEMAQFAQNEKREFESLIANQNEEDMLKLISFRPSMESVKNILNYSRSLAVKKTRKTGAIRMVLN